MCSFTVYPGVFLVCVFFIFVFFFWFYSYINALLALIHLWSILRTFFIFFSAISGKGLLNNSSSISTINPAPYLLALFMLCIELIITAFTGQYVSRTVLWKTWRICVEWKKKTLMKILKLRMNFCGLVLGPSTLRILLTRLEHHFLSPLFQNP